MNVLQEIDKARRMVENKTLSLSDFEALLIGLFARRTPTNKPKRRAVARKAKKTRGTH
jgi:hypothetical protein